MTFSIIFLIGLGVVLTFNFDILFILVVIAIAVIFGIFMGMIFMFRREKSSGASYLGGATFMQILLESIVVTTGEMLKEPGASFDKKRLVLDFVSYSGVNFLGRFFFSFCGFRKKIGEFQKFVFNVEENYGS